MYTAAGGEVRVFGGSAGLIMAAPCCSDNPKLAERNN